MSIPVPFISIVIFHLMIEKKCKNIFHRKVGGKIEGSLSVRWLTFRITRDSEYKQELKSVAERHKFGVKTYGWNLIMRQNYMEKNVT